MARFFKNPSTYKPYTYEELAAPIEKATVLLAQQAQSLSDLEARNSSLLRYLDPVTDKEEYEIYKENDRRLRTAAENLQRYGLSQGNFMMFRDLASTYSTDIRPIQEQVARRMQHKSQIAAFLTENPDAVVKGGYHRPLSQYRDGIPQLDIIKGSAVQKDVETVMAALAQARGSIDKVGVYDKYNDVVRSITGYSLEDLEKEIERVRANDPNSTFYDVIHKVLQRHGVEDDKGQNLLDDEQDYRKMLNYALNGTYAALGKATYNVADNGRKHEQQLAMQYSQQRQARIDKAFEMAYTAKVNGAKGSINEIAQAILNNDYDKAFGMQESNYDPDDFMNKNNYTFAKPSPSAITNDKVTIGGFQYSKGRVINIAKDANGKYAPTLNKDGSWDGSKLNNWRLKPGSGDGLLDSYVNKVCTELGIKDISHMSGSQRNDLLRKLNDYAEKARIVVPTYTYSFSDSGNAKNLLRNIQNSYIDENTPSGDIISKAVYVDLSVDCHTPDILNVKVLTSDGKTNSYKADITDFLNSYNIYDESLKQQLRAVQSMVNTKESPGNKFSSRLNEMFFKYNPAIYKHEIGNLYSIIGATLDGLVRDAANNTAVENDIFKPKKS